MGGDRLRVVKPEGIGRACAVGGIQIGIEGQQGAAKAVYARSIRRRAKRRLSGGIGRDGISSEVVVEGNILLEDNDQVLNGSCGGCGFGLSCGWFCGGEGGRGGWSQGGGQGQQQGHRPSGSMGDVQRVEHYFPPPGEQYPFLWRARGRGLSCTGAKRNIAGECFRGVARVLNEGESARAFTQRARSGRHLKLFVGTMVLLTGFPFGPILLSGRSVRRIPARSVRNLTLALPSGPHFEIVPRLL